jgi:hypothetical protein
MSQIEMYCCFVGIISAMWGVSKISDVLADDFIDHYRGEQ